MKDLTENQIKEDDKMLKKMQKKTLLWYLSTSYSGGPSLILDRENYLKYLKAQKNKSSYFKVANKFQRILEQSFEKGIISIKEKGSPNCLFMPIVETNMMEGIINDIDEDIQGPVTSQASMAMDDILSFAVYSNNLEPVEDTPGLFRIM